jgi:hypothetical protein
MPNCDFYAAGDDFRSVLEFIFGQPGWTLVELASLPDRPLRRFDAADAVLEAYDLATSSAHLQLYTPTLGGDIVEHAITFRPGAMGEAKGRIVSEGWGLIQLYLEGEREGRVGLSHTNHNSEARARSWEQALLDGLGPVDAWDWSEVTRVSRRLNQHIRRIAASKAGSRPILPEAWARVTGGASLAPN